MLQLGAFSISLSVKDLQVSKEFYEKLGFQVFAGSEKHNYFIMKSGHTLIGLFHGMFQNNMLTFNPGWDQEARTVAGFDSVQKIQKHLKENGIDLLTETEQDKSGPGSIMFLDPDGNTILIDQHTA